MIEQSDIIRAISLSNAMQMSEVDKRCIYASSEHLKMINLFISYGIEYPKVNQDFICLRKKRGPQSKPRLRLFAMGRRKAEVRVALIWVPKINDFNCLFWESGGTSCFNDDRVIGLRNLVTERDVTERVVIGQMLADFHASPLPLQP